MDGATFANNFTLYLMLIICVILLTVDILEMIRLSYSWNEAAKYTEVIFESCIKNELLLKTVFGVYSILAAIAAGLLTLFLIISIDFFLDKVLLTYIYMIYFIFGASMLGFSCLAMHYWNDLVYVCDYRNFHNKLFSVSNMLSLIICLTLSLAITVGACLYETVMLYINSILRRDNGNKWLRSIFWWTVLRTSGTDFMRNPGNRDDDENENNPQRPNIELQPAH